MMSLLMDQPETYSKSSLFAKRDVIEVLNEFSNKMNWNKNGDRVIDIGCADGGTTANIIKKYLPTNFVKLVGCDISENMIKFARERYSDQKTSFVLLDIGIELPNKHKGNYDHVFSFYLLHWIKNQSILFRNIYNLLDESGECLIAGLASIDIFDAYQAISRTNKWGVYLNNDENHSLPYQDCPDPVPTITRLMEEAGFTNINVECRNKTFVFDSLQDLKGFLRSFDAPDFPQEKLDDCLEDMVQIILKNKIMDFQINKDGEIASVQTKYKFIIAFGCK